MKPPKPKLAYTCRIQDEAPYGAYIKFAHSKNQLLRKEEFDEVERTPQHDRFAELGYIPAKQLHNDGWTLCCDECEKEVNDEGWDYEEDVQLNPVFVKSRVYCSQQCYSDCLNSRIAVRRRKEGVIKFLTSKYPGIEVRYCHVDRDRSYVNFKFPGGQGDVDWNDADPNHVRIQQRDLEAWQGFKQRIQLEVSAA